MIVNCDKCGLEYDVDESRLPPQGARIKCPTCHNIFLVRPNRSPQSALMPVAEEPEPSANPDPASPSPAAVDEEEWRVRHIGLTYSFHDLSALRDWLSARTSLDDVKVAKGADDWKELGDYPEILTTEMITKFFPLGDVPSSTRTTSGTLNGTLSGTLNGASLSGTLNGATLNGAKLGVTQTSADLSQSVQSKNKRQIKIEREKAKKAKEESTKKVILIAVGGVILIVVAVIAGVYFTKGRLPFTSAPVQPENTIETPSTPVPSAPKVVDNTKKSEGEAISDEEREVLRDQERAELLRQEDEKRNKVLAEASIMVNNRQWIEAKTTLESLNEERPDHLETLQLLAKTYRALGLNDKAAETEAHVRRVIDEEKRQEDAAQDMVLGDE